MSSVSSLALASSEVQNYTVNTAALVKAILENPDNSTVDNNYESLAEAA